MTYEGIITMFNQPRGWGFIQCANGEEFFFHISLAKTPLTLGAHVAFETAPPLKLGKKDQATNIRVVESGVGGAE